MKRLAKNLVLLFLCFTIPMLGCTNQDTNQISPPVKRVRWQEFSSGMAQAIKDNKVIFLSVHAQWCHPCHILEAEVYNDSTVASYLNDSLVAVKVDYEGDSPLPCGGTLKDAKLCLEENWKDPNQVSALPFFAFMTPQGKRLLSHVGVITRDEFLLLLMDMKDVKE